MRPIIILLPLCSLLGLTSCSRKEPLTSSASPTPRTTVVENKPVGAACSLLTSSEIESVQGQPVQGTVPSSQSYGGFDVGQCYFTLPTSSNSVVLTVTQPAAG